MNAAHRIFYCTQEHKAQLVNKIIQLHLSFLFSCPHGVSGFVWYRFRDGYTGERVGDVFPILN